MTKYLLRGDELHITDDSNLVVKDLLPTGTYTVYQHPVSLEYSLKVIPSYNVGKLYGDVSKRAERILNTYLSRTVSTGVLLSGEKGTGKTMLAKLLSLRAAERDVPTIVINEDHAGEPFNRFIQSISQPCIIIFDEFEKVYRETEKQEAMLTLLDGVYPTQKLFILTTNDRYGISRHMLNRPGRLFYHIEYRGLPDDFIVEYCMDSLKNTAEIPGVLKVAQVFEEFNFDMLKALIEEMNRYNETARDAIELMNIKPESYTGEYDVTVTVNGTKPDSLSEDTLHVDPMKNFRVYYYMTKKDTNNGNGKAVRIGPSDLVTIAKGHYTYHVGEGVTVTLTKKHYDGKTSLIY